MIPKRNGLYFEKNETLVEYSSVCVMYSHPFLHLIESKWLFAAKAYFEIPYFADGQKIVEALLALGAKRNNPGFATSC